MLAQQFKPDEAMDAFEKMKELGITPSDATFTQLMLAYAKRNNLEQVLDLERQASEKYQILPSLQRLNSILLAYARLGRAQEAERFLIDMREVYGV